MDFKNVLSRLNQLSESVKQTKVAEAVLPGMKPLAILDPKNQQAGAGVLTSTNPTIQKMLGNLDPKDVKIVQTTQQPMQTGTTQQPTATTGGATNQPAMAEEDDKWIQKAIKHPGALRKKLHAKPGKPIPAGKLEKATHSKDQTTARQARLAQTLRGLKEGDIPSVAGVDTRGAGLGVGRSDRFLENNTSPMSDSLAAKKIADKIQGISNLNIPNIKKYVTRYLSMVGKARTDIDHLSALVHTELDKRGLLEKTETEKKSVKEEAAWQRLQRLRDKQEDEEREKEEKDPFHEPKKKHGNETPKKQHVKGHRYGGSKQKDDVDESTSSVKNKQKVYENMQNKHTAARLLGKSHALAKEGYNCKFDNMEEAHQYHEGYKEGLDECYGNDSSMATSMHRGMLDETLTGNNTLMNRVVDEIESWLDHLNTGECLGDCNESHIEYALSTSHDSEMRDLWERMQDLSNRQYKEEINNIIKACGDRDENQNNDDDGYLAVGEIDEAELDEVSRGEYIRQQDKKAERSGKDKFHAFGQTFDTDDVNETFTSAFENWDRQLNSLLTEGEVNEGMSVSITKGQQGSPDSVTISAQDNEAEQLLSLIKHAGLGLFGDDETSFDGDQLIQKPGNIDVVGDHDGMMALIRKVTHGPSAEQDYEDEEVCDNMDENVMGAALGAVGGAMLGKTPNAAMTGAQIGDKIGDAITNSNSDNVEEETCNECGYMESKCECDKEQVEEYFNFDELNKKEREPRDHGTDELQRRADLDSRNTKRSFMDKFGKEYKEKGKYGDMYSVKGPKGKLPESEELDEVESSDQMLYRVAESLKKLDEWANEAGKIGTDTQFEQDIEFMTKVISGGLNKPKSTGQTTIPVIPGQELRMEDPMNYSKLAGIKK